MAHGNEKVSYTSKSQTLYLILTFVFALISGVFALLMYLEPNVGSTLSGLILVGFLGFHLFEICFLVIFLDSVFYIRRLKMYGYCMEDTNFRKGALLREIQRDETKKPNRKRSGESITLVILAGTFSLVYMILVMWKWMEYQRIGWSFWGGNLLMLFPSFLWALNAWIYYKQSNDKKYKDDVESDETRKYRKQVVLGVFRSLIWGFITLQWFELMETFFGYTQTAQEDPTIVYVLRSLI